MSNDILKISGEVAQERGFSYQQLVDLPAEMKIPDVSQVDASRAGVAIRLNALLDAVGVHPDAHFLGLHSAHDNFHASVPLAELLERAFLIFQLNDQPLPREKGGPVRFYIPDHASCQTHDIDECANVKFVDHIELTKQRGFDNRPQDEQEHAKLHQSP